MSLEFTTEGSDPILLNLPVIRCEQSHLDVPLHPAHNPEIPSPEREIPSTGEITPDPETPLVSAIETLDQAITQVLSTGTTPSYQRLYSTIEYLCRSHHHVELYTHIKGKLEAHFEANPPTLSPPVLQSFLDLYHSWQAKLTVLSKIYMYLDKTYLLRLPTKKEVFPTGMAILVSECLAKANLSVISETDENPLRQQLVAAFLHESQTRPPLAVVEFTKTILALDTAKTIRFEEIIRSSILNFYRNSFYPVRQVVAILSSETAFLEQCGCPSVFTLEVVARVRFELLYLDEAALEKRMAEAMSEAMAGDTTALRYLFQFYTEPYAQRCVDQWGAAITAIVRESLNDGQPLEVVNGLSRLQNQIMGILNDAYGEADPVGLGGSPVDDTLSRLNLRTREAFREGMASHGLLVVESLTKALDALIKAKETEFSTPCQIYNLIREKQIFYFRYKRDLSKRLLLQKSPLASEREFLRQVLPWMDTEHHRVLLSMIDDLTAVLPLATFQPMVVEKTTWPDLPVYQSVILPPSLHQPLAAFEAAYKEQHARTLTWVHYLHQITLTVFFPLGEKELTLNTYQASVLMMFEPGLEYTVAEISRTTGLTSGFLSGVLRSLMGKYPVLIDGPKITFNETFSSPMRELRLPHVVGSAPEDVAAFTGPAAVDVQWFIESFLMRYLKSHREAAYTTVISAVILQLRRRFSKVDLKQVKKVVERLIEKGYVERKGDALLYVP